MELREYQNSGKTYIIAEIAQAHDGSFGILQSLVRAAAAAGADAVKFQVHIAEAESSEIEPFRVKFSDVDRTRFDYWKRMELSLAQWKSLKVLCQKLNVEFLATPFSNEAVDLLEKVGVERYKIGSGDVSNHLLLEKVCKTGKEIILSSGLSSLAEIQDSVQLLKKYQIPYCILQCTTKYPTEAEDVGLTAITELGNQFNCPTGLSDHSGEIYAGLAAVAIGAVVIETHITFDKEMFGPDAKASLTIDMFSQLVDGIRFVEKARNSGSDKSFDSSKQELSRIFGKSLSINKNLSKGHILEFSDLEGKKPADAGMPVSSYSHVIGQKLTIDKCRGDFLRDSDVKVNFN